MTAIKLVLDSILYIDRNGCLSSNLLNIYLVYGTKIGRYTVSKDIFMYINFILEIYTTTCPAFLRDRLGYTRHSKALLLRTWLDH